MGWFFACVALVPLIFCPRFIFNGFALPQTLAVSLLSTASLTIGVASGVVPDTTSAPIGLAFVFLFYMCLATLWTFPQHNAKKELGLQAPLVVLFLFSSIWLTRDMINVFALTTTIGATLSAFYGHIQTLGIDPFFPNRIKQGGPTTNAIGTIGNPNFLASYLGPSFWLAIYSALVFEKMLILLAAFIGYVIVFKTRAKAGLVALFGSGVFFILTCGFFGLIPNGELIFHLGLAMMIFCTIMVLMVAKQEWQTFWWKPIDPNGPQIWYSTARYRLCYWLVGLFLVKQRPWWGWGLWSYRREVYAAQARINDKYPGFLDQKRYITPQPRECHNDYVEHLVEYGLVGFSIFMLFVIFVVQKGMNTLVSTSGNDFFLILLLISALVSILINAFFFFGLRIPSTAMMFWMISAIIVSFQGNHFQSFIPRWWLTAAIIVLGIGFVWECVGKRVFSNRYFILFMKSQKRSMGYINKALDFAPYDSILRTHASMSWADHDITMSRNHAQKLLHFFDGQTPLWASLFNVGLAVARGAKDALEEANLYLKTSHYILPYFKPTLEILNGRESISIRTKYKGGNAIMRVVNGETAWRIRALIEKKGSCERDLALLQAEVDKINLKRETVSHQMALCDSNVENAILLEKKRLNIPDSWIYDPEKAEFKDPQSLPPEEQKRLGVG